MNQPDPEQYAGAVQRLQRIVAKLDSMEERARSGVDNGLWRKLHFLRLEVRKLCSDMETWQAPAEGAVDADGDTAEK